MLDVNLTTKCTSVLETTFSLSLNKAITNKNKQIKAQSNIKQTNTPTLMFLAQAVTPLHPFNTK